MVGIRSSERRSARRKVVALPVVYSAGRCEGEAFLDDISESGALLTSSASTPAPGTAVLVHVPADPDHPLRGVVARQTKCGFAVRFRAASESDADLLDCDEPTLVARRRSR